MHKEAKEKLEVRFKLVVLEQAIFSRCRKGMHVMCTFSYT
jgi:hypothetical protein